MKYGYQRVSTKGQARDGNSLEAQTKALKAAGAEKIYSDAFTGTKSHRPELDKLLDVLQPGDTFIVTKLDRVARSTLQGTELIQQLLERGIIVYVLNMGLMDNTPTGKLIRNVMLAFAEFERDMIIERTSEGKAIARQNPEFKDGRPFKYMEEERRYAQELLKTCTYKEVQTLLGISKSTLRRIKKEKFE
mgnify:CR=1 FL=1